MPGFLLPCGLEREHLGSLEGQEKLPSLVRVSPGRSRRPGGLGGLGEKTHKEWMFPTAMAASRSLRLCGGFTHITATTELIRVRCSAATRHERHGLGGGAHGDTPTAPKSKGFTGTRPYHFGRYQHSTFRYGWGSLPLGWVEGEDVAHRDSPVIAHPSQASLIQGWHCPVENGSMFPHSSFPPRVRI